ncbi:MAG: AAA family ATPase [Planctomycetes bacterium]|nr:AAA family ATPase [Planctomycetota bacterium]
MVIAVAGKGGTGKSTVAALLIRALLAQNKKPVLAVDADPNSTLGDYLGITCSCTVADLIEQTKGLRNLPDGVSKPAHLEYQLQSAITESAGVDLLVMGRPEGPDCYCMANNILRGYVQKIVGNYPYVVIDNEAGMEHLSRKTTQNIDALLLVSDSTEVGLKTAGRIRELIDKMPFLNIRNKYLLINRVNNSINTAQAEEITGLKIIGTIPYSEEIEKQINRKDAKILGNIDLILSALCASTVK